jgi:hypothetical protein
VCGRSTDENSYPTAGIFKIRSHNTDAGESLKVQNIVKDRHIRRGGRCRNSAGKYSTKVGTVL